MMTSAPQLNQRLVHQVHVGMGGSLVKIQLAAKKGLFVRGVGNDGLGLLGGDAGKLGQKLPPPAMDQLRQFRLMVGKEQKRR